MVTEYSDGLLQDRTDDSLIGAERSVVGAMMLDGRRVAEVRSVLRPTDFYDVRYQAIAETCFELHQKGRPVDVISVGTRMRVTGRFVGNFDESLLHELTSEVPTAANAGYYAEIVAGGATRRRLRAAGLKLIGAADNPAVDILGAIDEGRELLDDAIPGDLDQKPVGAFSDEFFERLAGDKLEVTRTPWPDLDALIHGWKPGHLAVIGARPAQGKTVIACQIASVAAQSGGVAYFTGEMDNFEILGRLYASIGGIPLGIIERRDASRFEDRFAETRKIVDGLDLYIDDRATTWDDIEMATWDLYRKGNLKMIVIDHLGTYRDGSGKHESRSRELESMVQRAKRLAKRLKITVVLLSQLNRGGAPSVELKRPSLETLRDTDALEQFADVVILLHQETTKNSVTKQVEKTGNISLLLEKQRSGPTGVVELNFEGAYARATHKMHAR